MSFSELANWDGSLSAKKPHSKGRTAFSSNSSYKGMHAAHASESAVNNYTPKLASRNVGEGSSASSGQLAPGDSKWKGSNTAAGLCGVQTRSSTVNAVAFAFGNDQTLMDSGCIPSTSNHAVDPNETTADPAEAVSQNTLEDDASSDDKEVSAGTTLSGELQNKASEVIAKPATTFHPEHNDNLPPEQQIPSGKSGLLPLENKLAYQVPKEVSSGQSATAADAYTRKEVESPLPPLPSPSERTEKQADPKRLVFDGICMPRLTHPRYLYKPFASYYPSRFEELRNKSDTDPSSVSSGNDVASEASTTDFASSSCTTMPPSTSQISAASMSLVDASGLTASTPILVDGPSESRISEEREQADLLASQQSQGPSNARSPTAAESSTAIVTEEHPHVRPQSPTSANVVSASMEEPSRARSVDTEREALRMERPGRTSIIAANFSPTHSTTPSCASGSSSDEDEDDRTDFDKYEPFCHQCRSKNVFAKMKCTKIDNDTICSLSYCHRCIILRYPDIVFDLNSANFICPKCLNSCACDKCCAMRGDAYEPIKDSRKRLRGVSLFISNLATLKDQQNLPVLSRGDRAATRGTRGRRGRGSRTTHGIGREAEAWLRKQHIDSRRAGRLLTRSFVGEWSNAWGEQPLRIREMDCAFSETDASQEECLMDKRRRSLYIGEPLHEVARRMKKRRQDLLASSSSSFGTAAETTHTIGEVVSSQRRTTPGVPDFTYNIREGVPSSLTSAESRLETPSSHALDYNSYLMPSLRRGNNVDVPMLSSVIRNDETGFLDLDQENSQPDRAQLPFLSPFTQGTTTEVQARPFGSGIDPPTDAVGLLSGFALDSGFPSSDIYGAPSYSGLSKDELERVTKMALASLTGFNAESVVIERQLY